MTMRHILAAAAALCVFSQAFAEARQPYSADAYQDAAQSGQPVLIEVHADWCPTCRMQEPVLDKLSKEPQYRHIARFRVDFDTQKDAVKRFNARAQSTLVLLQGGAEIARAVGVTDEARIRALLDQARAPR